MKSSRLARLPSASEVNVAPTRYPPDGVWCLSLRRISISPTKLLSPSRSRNCPFEPAGMRSGARNITPDTLMSSTLTVDHSGRLISVPSIGGTRGHCRRSISPGRVCARDAAPANASSIGRVPSAHASPIKYRTAPDALPSSSIYRTSAFTSRWLPCRTSFPLSRLPVASGTDDSTKAPPGLRLRTRCRCHVSRVPGSVPTSSNLFFTRRSPRIRSFTTPRLPPLGEAPWPSAPTGVQRSRQLGRLVSSRQIPLYFAETGQLHDLVRQF